MLDLVKIMLPTVRQQKAAAAENASRHQELQTKIQCWACRGQGSSGRRTTQELLEDLHPARAGDGDALRRRGRAAVRTGERRPGRQSHQRGSWGGAFRQEDHRLPVFRGSGSLPAPFSSSQRKIREKTGWFGLPTMIAASKKTFMRAACVLLGIVSQSANDLYTINIA